MRTEKVILALSVTLLIWVMSAAMSKAEPVNIVGLGDSLMAGYQLQPGEGFPAQLEKALIAKGIQVKVTDAGVSGDTSSGGLARLDWSVPDGTDYVLLELGANDALRGISPEITKTNLETMISRLQSRNIKVILAGMLAPPNMGKDYGDTFNQLFPMLAAKYGLPLIPFFLDGVAGVPQLQLDDNMHPNPSGVAKMVEGALPVMMKALDQASQ